MNELTGLQKLCKLYGRMTVTADDGTTTEWVWDYANDVAIHKKDMTLEMFKASERAKWSNIKAQMSDEAK